MKRINDFILEKLRINKETKINQYNYQPKNKDELMKIISEKYKDNRDILDLNDIDVSKITNLSYLFEKMKPREVNMNNWNVSNVTDIHGLFWNNQMTEIIHIEDWDVSNVETAYGAFYFCENVKELNLDNWNFEKCKEFDLMFKGCKNLDTHFTDNWNINEDALSGDMFEGCKYVPKWYEKLKN